MAWRKDRPSKTLNLRTANGRNMTLFLTVLCAISFLCVTSNAPVLATLLLPITFSTASSFVFCYRLLETQCHCCQHCTRHEAPAVAIPNSRLALVLIKRDPRAAVNSFQKDHNFIPVSNHPDEGHLESEEVISVTSWKMATQQS